MIQLRIKTFCVTLGIIGIICYATLISQSRRNECSVRFDSGKYENVTYSLHHSYTNASPDYSLFSEIDYNTLMDIDFTFTIENFVCNDTEPLLLVLVHSAPGNFAKRKVVRETWGRREGEEDIKILFLVGTPDDSEIQDKLQNENFLHDDLLQGSFLDSYRNLTYKHVMGLKFVTYHCPQAKYILKIDDDVCVNTPMLKNFLTRDLSPYGAKNLLMCNVIQKTPVLRSFRSKWRVTFEEFQEKYYPPYCPGWYILYSPDLVFQLYREVQRAEYFWIDDVLMTGMLPAKLNFNIHTDISLLTLTHEEINSPHKCKPFLFGYADMREREIRSLWNYIVNNPVPQSVMETLITESYKYGSTVT